MPKDKVDKRRSLTKSKMEQREENREKLRAKLDIALQFFDKHPTVTGKQLAEMMSCSTTFSATLIRTLLNEETIQLHTPIDRNRRDSCNVYQKALAKSLGTSRIHLMESDPEDKPKLRKYKLKIPPRDCLTELLFGTYKPTRIPEVKEV